MLTPSVFLSKAVHAINFYILPDPIKLLPYSSENNVTRSSALTIVALSN